MAASDDKTSQMAHAEDVESGLTPKHIIDRRISVQHGDRALAIVGDQRIDLTEEDVSWNHDDSLCRMIEPDNSLEQANSKKDRQGYPQHPRLGLFPPDSGQISPRLWRPVWSAKRHPPHWKPVFPRRVDCSHRPTGLAAFLLLPDCQGPSSNFDAISLLGVGYCSSLHGRLPQL